MSVRKPVRKESDSAMNPTTSRLLEPVRLGAYLLRNRIVMPPLTRHRADENDVPTPHMAVYYGQRASAGLIISEGAPVSRQGVGYPHTPGIYSPLHAEAWRPITEAVHARGGLMFQQLWHVGRQSHSSIQPAGELPVAPSAIAINGSAVTREGLKPFETPRPLTLEEIPGVVDRFVSASRLAMNAGFDGVEIHGANGYLFDQFLNDGCNTRTDEYGGSIENRMRLLLEVTVAVAEVWGADRVGVRLSPSSVWMDCTDSDQVGTYSAMVRALDPLGLAYLHLVEPQIAGADTVAMPDQAVPTSHYRSQYSGTVIVTGEHTPESGEAAISSGLADLIGFGRTIIANPDLAARIAASSPLNEQRREYFYEDHGPLGYTDYPSLVDEKRWADVQTAIEAGRISEFGLRADLLKRHPLHLVESGDHYVAQRLASGDMPVEV